MYPKLIAYKPLASWGRGRRARLRYVVLRLATECIE